MQLKYRLPLAILASAAFAACFVHAQDDDDEEEEFGSFGFYSKSPQAVSMSLNLTNGPKVNFGKLGNLPITVDHTSAGITTRKYDDGLVSKDERRAYNASNPAESEYDSEGTPLYRIGPVGTRYKTYTTPGDPSSAVATDYLAYQPGLTRSWSYNNASQALARPGYIAFNVYSAHTNGESLSGSRGYTGGVELAVAHDLTDVRKRFSLRLVASLTLTGINSQKIGQVNSALQTYTDYYRFQPYVVGSGAPAFSNLSDGTAPVPLYTAGSAGTFDSTTVAGLTTETTTTLSQNPDDHADDSSPGQNVVVHGIWKVKGAYFTVKIGPEVSAMVTRNLGLRASLGLAGSYVGTTYSANETFTVEGTASPLALRGTESSTTNKALPGYYANIDATWTLNERTGMFAGFSYDNLGEYTQGVGGRTAKIDLSATAGVRGGLNIKF